LHIIRPDDEYTAPGPCAAALGFFDGVHRGHAAVIAQAAASGLPVTVVTFLRHPSLLLGGSPVKALMTNAHKESVLRGLGVAALCYLDFASFRDMPASDFIGFVTGTLGAQRVACGFNYRFGAGAQAGAEELGKLCAQRGAEGLSVRPVCAGGAPVSSTRIRALIRKGDMPGAADMLGRYYGYRLRVIHGRSLARTFGTPTINQAIPKELAAPRYGVYASFANIGGRALPAVTNVGIKPTVGGHRLLAETYIIGYDGDLYGRTVGVDLVRFMRPEIKFASLGELKAQIELDAQSSLAFTRG
jgi:riboflavin kinase/FMN adenylyltransferase